MESKTKEMAVDVIVSIAMFGIVVFLLIGGNNCYLQINNNLKKDQEIERVLIIECMKYDNTRDLMLTLRDDMLGLNTNDRMILNRMLKENNATETK
jgi:hypothetical protein